MESDAPRTDAENYIYDIGLARWVSIEFARQLERELAAAQARILELRDEVAILRLYGNKDCTSMADAALAAMRKGEQNGK